MSTRAGLHSFLESDRMVVRSQARTMLVTLGVVFAFLLLLWRSFLPALLATILTAAPVGMALGAAGFFGITQPGEPNKP